MTEKKVSNTIIDAIAYTCAAIFYLVGLIGPFALVVWGNWY